MARVESPKSPLVAKLRGVHLFHFEGAPCAQRVRFALAEKGLARGRDVPWQSDAPDALVAPPGTWLSRPVSLIKREHLSEAYAAIHPDMVVPALVHDGQLHLESMDIVRYADETFPGPRLFPADPGQAAACDALVEEAVRLHVSVRYVSFRWGLGRLGKLDAAAEATLRRLEREGSPEQLVSFYARFDRDQIDEATFVAHLRALESGFARLDQRLAGGGPYLLGEFSMADIPWSLCVLRISECGYPFERYPALSRWYAAIERRPGFRNGVMARHRTLSRAFRLKAALENLFGVGLRAASLRAP
jgi:glutathione S-transferase